MTSSDVKVNVKHKGITDLAAVSCKVLQEVPWKIEIQ